MYICSVCISGMFVLCFFCLIHQDVLGQDMFLVGAPGPLRRHLALAYCELTGREMEYVSLSRDTTETDLKQRREIVAGTVHYVDQVSVCVSLCLSVSLYVTVCVSLIPIIVHILVLLAYMCLYKILYIHV